MPEKLQLQLLPQGNNTLSKHTQLNYGKTAGNLLSSLLYTVALFCWSGIEP